MASDRLQRARELDDIGGSFLTSVITEALGDRLSEADYDRDNAIDLNDLMRWLANRASAHNKTYPKKQVPIPFVFGRERGRIYLTIEPTAWPVHEIGPIAGHTFVVLPAQAERKRAWLIGKTPVTNKQYQQFVRMTGWPEPSGQSFVAGNKRKFWRSGFQPWKDEKFGAADMPVVCVAFEDASRFFDWLSDEITDFEVQLIPTRVWDYAAFGNEYPSFDRQIWLTGNIHDKNDVPAEVSNACDRANCFGAIDLFGNVWEWTTGGHAALERIGILAASKGIMRNQQLRGGSFLDDLSMTSPILTVAALPDGIETRHFDLGFRIAGKTALKSLPEDVATRVADCPRIQPDADNVRAGSVCVNWEP